MDPEFAGKPMRSGAYISGRTDVDQIPDTPNRRAHHRRALSETFFRFSNLDDFLLDDLVSEMNIDLPPAPASVPHYASPPPAQLCKAHLRSLSFDADFFEELALNGGPPVSDSFPSPSPRPVSIHRHTNSMDGYSSATSADVDSGKKVMAPDQLAELALIDPQRAKRILANRQSAARSKERKVHYTGELERKVHTLQTEATTLSAQTTLLQLAEMDPEFAGKPMRSGAYISGRTDVDQIPDTPNRRAHHRRALSETFFRFSNLDDFLLDDLVSEMNIDLPPAPASVPHYASPPPAQLCKAHLRSLSFDADFFEELALNGGPPVSDSFPSPSPRPVSIHRHTNSMDGYSSATSADVDSGKKVMAPDQLAELALIDPQRAKRILANRQSAARSKERKVHYTGELERKVHTLQTEATTLSAQTTLLQRDATGLANENRELKLKLQAMEQQAHLRDALNETLSNELQRLKTAAGQIPDVNRNNRGLTSQFFSGPPTFSYMGNNQAQQQQQQTQQPVHYPNNPRLGGQLLPTFEDFNHRA